MTYLEALAAEARRSATAGILVMYPAHIVRREHMETNEQNALFSELNDNMQKLVGMYYGYDWQNKLARKCAHGCQYAAMWKKLLGFVGVELAQAPERYVPVDTVSHGWIVWDSECGTAQRVQDKATAEATARVSNTLCVSAPALMEATK